MLHARVHFCTLKVLKVKHKGYHHDIISYLQLPFAKELFCPRKPLHQTIPNTRTRKTTTPATIATTTPEDILLPFSEGGMKSA